MTYIFSMPWWYVSKKRKKNDYSKYFINHKHGTVIEVHLVPHELTNDCLMYTKSMLTFKVTCIVIKIHILSKKKGQIK